MTKEQSAAFVYAQATAAAIEAISMQMANKERAQQGMADAYDEPAFLDLIGKYGLEHGALLHTLGDAS